MSWGATIASLSASVAALISDLASTSSGKGSDMIGARDTGTLYSGVTATVSAFLQAVRTVTILKASSTLTVASGAITVTQGVHLVETESSAATDDLDTINGGVTGQFIKLCAVTGTRVTRIRHGQGNIEVPLGMDVVLDSSRRFVELYYNGSVWYVLDADGWMTTTLAAPAANVTLTFPQTGTKIEIEAKHKSTQTGVGVNSLKCTVITAAGSDTTITNYETQWNGASNGAASNPRANTASCSQHATADSVGGFGELIMVFPNHRDTDNPKQWFARWGVHRTSTIIDMGQSYNIRKTTGVGGAITDALTGCILTPGSGNWDTGSRFRVRVLR